MEAQGVKQLAQVHSAGEGQSQGLNLELPLLYHPFSPLGLWFAAQASSGPIVFSTTGVDSTQASPALSAG